VTKNGTRSEALQRRADAGARNLAAFLATEETLPDFTAAVARFESELIADLGAKVNAARRSLVESAGASYLVVLLAKQKLLRLRRWRRVTNDIVDLLSREQGNLARALRDLGVSPKSTGDDPGEQPRGGLREYLNGKAEGGNGAD